MVVLEVTPEPVIVCRILSMPELTPVTVRVVPLIDPMTDPLFGWIDRVTSAALDVVAKAVELVVCDGLTA